MDTYKHPGVFVEELPGMRAIEGVSTNIAVFVGVVAQMPVRTKEEQASGPEAVLVTSWNDYTRKFGKFAWDCFLPYAVYMFFAEGGSICYIVPVQESANTAGAPSKGTVGSTTFNAASPGPWGDSLSILIADAGTPAPSSSGGSGGTTAASPIFNMMVVYSPPKQSSGGADAVKPLGQSLIEAFIKLNAIPMQTDAKEKKDYYVLEQFSSLSKDSFAPQALAARVNTRSIFIRVDDSADSSGSGGGSADPKRPANGMKALSGGQAAEYNYAPALDAIKKVHNASLLALPDSVSILSASAGGKSSPYAKQQALINQGLLFCEQQQDIFFVADPPFNQDTSGILDFRQSGNAFNSSYGALYYPWMQILDPLSGNVVLIPPSGAVLGRYAETDDRVGVYKAPAGTDDGKLDLAYALEQKVTDADQDLLNPAGINAIRTLFSYGICIWGCRTLSHDTEWLYVNVRRLFIFVEQSIKESMQWVVFQPNGPRLWASVTRDIGSFLKDLWMQGALYGTSASEAYFVTCDESNNPIEEQEKGYLHVTVGIRPLFPAEFVVIQFTQKTGSGSS